MFWIKIFLIPTSPHPLLSLLLAAFFKGKGMWG